MNVSKLDYFNIDVLQVFPSIFIEGGWFWAYYLEWKSIFLLTSPLCVLPYM